MKHWMIGLGGAAILAATTVGGCEKDDASKSASSPAAENVTAKSAAPDPGTVPQPANAPAPATGPADAAGVAETPAAPSVPQQPSPDAPAPAVDAKRDSAGGVSWGMPAGWSRGPEAPMRLVTLTDGTAEIRVSSFPGNVGGVLLNINRWRGEVGLPPVASDAEAEKMMTDVDVDGRKIRVADMTGERARTIVANVPGEGKLYFFKMSGPPDVVAARKDAFDQLVKTIRVEQQALRAPVCETAKAHPRRSRGNVPLMFPQFLVE